MDLRERILREQRVSLMRRVLFIVAVLAAAVPALAHSWYPLTCCGNIDCSPVACDQLVETGLGWLYIPTGNLFKREQVQPSQTEIAMCASGSAGITARSARSSCRTYSRSAAAIGGDAIVAVVSLASDCLWLC